MARSRDIGYIAKPPLLVQRAVFGPLGAVARLLGYRMPRPYPYTLSRHPDATVAREEVRT